MEKVDLESTRYLLGKVKELTGKAEIAVENALLVVTENPSLAKTRWRKVKSELDALHDEVDMIKFLVWKELRGEK